MRWIKCLVIVTLSMLSINSYAQQQTDNYLWKVFASGSINWETFETSNVRQDFIDVNQDGNKFVWGNDNSYRVYNKKVEHDGFKTYTTYDFVDKYNQRGKLIYLNDRSADWAMKHVFYIRYEGNNDGMFYCSNEPKKK